MDSSSKVTVLKTPKPPTIASRRPMLSSHKSFTLSINTSATHHDMMRRNSSSVTRHRLLHTPTNAPPLPLSAHNGNHMSPEELSSKIADSFQQFSSMLSQLSSNKSVATPVTPTSHHHKTPTTYPTNNMQTETIARMDHKLPSPPMQHTSFKCTPSPTKVVTQGTGTLETLEQKNPQKYTIEAKKSPELPKKKKVQETDTEEEMQVEQHSSHAMYLDNALLQTNAINKCDTILRQHILSKWLTRAASIGDLDGIQTLLTFVQDLDFNCTDDKRLGITPLMYAAYFGHLHCLQFLLKQPQTRIDQQDKQGWTALMWAINSYQLEVTKELLDHGADKSIKTRLGRSIFDFSTSSELKAVLGSPSVDLQSKSVEKTESKALSIEKNDVLSQPIATGEMDYYQAAVSGYNTSSIDQSITTSTETTKKSTTNASTIKAISPPDFSQLTRAITSPHQIQRKKEIGEVIPTDVPDALVDVAELKRWETSIISSNTFSWNQYLPDQMLVFSQDDLHFILDQAIGISDVKHLMNLNPLDNELWRPANIIFLSARFAHYCSSKDLLNTLLVATNVKLSRVIKAGYRDCHVMAYWIANICQLSSYLKKDVGLSVTTCEAQENLSALISEAYSYFITESQKSIEKIMEPSLMEYESIQEFEQVEFIDDWQRFFRRSSTNYSRHSTDTISSQERKLSMDSISSTATSVSNKFLENQSNHSPHAVTHLLTSIQSKLQAFHVPPAIVIQAIAQFFHYLSCELFNRILTYKKYICRSKALQIRMNLSVIDEWVRSNQLPSSLNNAFDPLMQLLQLLQCLSQMDDIVTFTSTVQTFDKLNPLQIKRCVLNYRYEVSESRLPEEIEQVANQMVASHQKNRSASSSSKRHSVNGSIQTRLSLDNLGHTHAKLNKGRPASISSLNCLLSNSANKRRLSTEELQVLNNHTVQQLDDDEEYDDQGEEKRNSKYVLPFSIPITTALLQDWTEEKHRKSLDNAGSKTNLSDSIYHEIKLKKQEQYHSLDKIYPTIPEEWLYNLDRRLYSK